MKFIQIAVMAAFVALAGCSGDPAKKNSTSKREPLSTRERCPPGYLLDTFTRQCVEQESAQRRDPLRDTLGRPMESMPDFSLPGGGILRR